MKVDEQFKCKDCDNYSLCNYYNNRRETSFICKEFQNQWGFIEELEKIKAEIRNKSFSYSLTENFENDIVIGVITVSDMEKILDNHISELKGEIK